MARSPGVTASHLVGRFESDIALSDPMAIGRGMVLRVMPMKP